MSVSVKFQKNKQVRAAFKNQLEQLVTDEVVKKIYVDDADLEDARRLPAVCIFFEDGDTNHETMDESGPKLTTANLTIKIKAKLDDTGDDQLDDIATAVTTELDKDLDLGGLLKDEVLFDSFAYLRDPNQIYTVLVLSAEIQFYQ